MRVRELAEWLGATFEGDGEIEVTGAAALEAAGPSEIAFIGTRKAAEQAGVQRRDASWFHPNGQAPRRAR